MNGNSLVVIGQETLFDKMWKAHVIRELDDGVSLLHVDRHVLQEATSAQAFAGLDRRGLKARNPELSYAVIDHIVSTERGRTGETYPGGRELIHLMRKNCESHGIELLDIDHPWQGIVHVVSPELGIALPGVTLVCGDSHTATSGGIGAYAWGIGTSEIEHVLATQSILQRRPKRLRVMMHGAIAEGVHPKDLILYLIGKAGVAAGVGHAVEYAGPAIRGLSAEGRLTICNMSIEFGARTGFIAPDDVAFQYLAGRPFAPKGAAWEAAVASWRNLHSDPDAVFDKEIDIDCSQISPQVTWGTSPQDVISVDGAIPDPSSASNAERRAAMNRALEYVDLSPGQPIEGIPVDVAFIGSCTNGRLSDLEAAAAVVRGRKVAADTRALVVPGSAQVKRAAEAKGLDRIFIDAGFEWRESGCSMCLALNDDQVAPGQRCISTSNRNFEERQGPRSRTHLASPASVAAAAVTGRITDVRKLMSRV